MSDKEFTQEEANAIFALLAMSESIEDIRLEQMTLEDWIRKYTSIDTFLNSYKDSLPSQQFDLRSATKGEE